MSEFISPDLVIITVLENVYEENGKLESEYQVTVGLMELPEDYKLTDIGEALLNPSVKCIDVATDICGDNPYELAQHAAKTITQMYSAVASAIMVVDRNDQIVAEYTIEDLLADDEIPTERVLH